MPSVRIFDTISDSAIVFVKNKVLECIYPTRDLMISNPIRRYGAAILMLLTCIFSGSVLATTHTATKSHKAPTVKKISSTKVSSKQEYSRNSVKSSSLPDLRKYPSGTPRKKAFLRTVMPYITKQNQAITADRNWLISKQYDARWSPTEKVRLKDIASRYKVKWSGNTRHVPGTRCLSVSTLFRTAWWRPWRRRKVAGVPPGWRARITTCSA